MLLEALGAKFFRRARQTMAQYRAQYRPERTAQMARLKRLFHLGSHIRHSPSPDKSSAKPVKSGTVSNVLISKALRNHEPFLKFLAFGMIFSHDKAGQALRYAEQCKAEWLATEEQQDLSRTQRHGVIRDLLSAIAGDAFDQGQKAPTLTMGFSGGGLDSRALLYALNQAGRMPTLYTFGQIGSLDFDLSHLLAERLGLKIAFVDTSEIDWKRESFEEAAANTQDIAVSPRVAATKALDERYGTRIDIHGYLNDSLTGGHLPAVLSNDWDAAVAYFCSWNDAFRFQQFLPLDSRRFLPTKPLANGDSLSYDWQLDFGYRQSQRIRLVPRGAPSHYLFPYDDPRWIGFWLCRSHQDLAGQALYLDFLRNLKSELFFDLMECGGTSRKTVKVAVRKLLYGSDGKAGIVDVTKSAKIPAAPPYSYGHFCFFACYANNARFRKLVEQTLVRLRKRDVFNPSYIDHVENEFHKKKWTAAKMLNGLMATDFALEVGKFD